MKITLSFEKGTVTEITGTKEEIIAELQNLINQIEALGSSEEFGSASLYDANGNDHIVAYFEQK